MKNFLILFLFASSIIAQNTCETSGESLVDLNSITKCSIETVNKKDSKSTRQISVKISAPKTRFHKKRTNKSVASSIDNLEVSGLSETKHAVELSNVLALTNTLSVEEVKKAKSFTNVDKIPLFKSCESSSKKDQLDCFNVEMIKHIEKHFIYPKEAIVKRIEGKVWVRFVIDSEGTVTNIKTLGPKGAEVLNNEAKRVISKLPKFEPAKIGGTTTTVKYGMPISFELAE